MKSTHLSPSVTTVEIKIDIRCSDLCCCLSTCKCDIIPNKYIVISFYNKILKNSKCQVFNHLGSVMICHILHDEVKKMKKYNNPLWHSCVWQY